MARQANGSLLKFIAYLRLEPGRRSLFEHLLVAALNRAVTTTQSHHFAMQVGNDLDLDVSASGDEFFTEEIPVAKGRERL